MRTHEAGGACDKGSHSSKAIRRPQSWSSSDQVVKAFREELGIKLIHVDAEERFLAKLAGETEPEAKRKIIGAEFIRVFEDEARKLADAKYLVQEISIQT